MEQSIEKNTVTSADLDHVPPRALRDLKDETAKLLTAPSNFCFKVPMAPEDWSAACGITDVIYFLKLLWDQETSKFLYWGNYYKYKPSV